MHSKFFWTNSVSRRKFADENTGNIPTMNLFSGAFIKQLQKLTFNFIMSVCMSVLKSVDQIQFCLKSDRNIEHFVWKYAWVMIISHRILLVFKKDFRQIFRKKKMFYAEYILSHKLCYLRDTHKKYGWVREIKGKVNYLYGCHLCAG